MVLLSKKFWHFIRKYFYSYCILSIFLNRSLIIIFRLFLWFLNSSLIFILFYNLVELFTLFIKFPLNPIRNEFKDLDFKCIFCLTYPFIKLWSELSFLLEKSQIDYIHSSPETCSSCLLWEWVMVYGKTTENLDLLYASKQKHILKDIFN